MCSKWKLRFIPYIVNLPPPKITANSTPMTKQNGDTHTEYMENQTIVISNFLKLPLTFLEVAVFCFVLFCFFFTWETKVAKLQRKVFTQFIHSLLFKKKKKKPSHLTPGLGLCSILGKRQIRLFLGVKIQHYMPKSHLRVDIVFQNNIGIKEWSRCKPHDDSWLKWP